MRRFCTLLLLILLASPAFSLTRFVNDSRPNDTGDGLTWATAHKSLITALTAAASGDEIWVASGTYKPTSTTDRTISFIMKDGVGLYGGFTSGQASLSDRNPDPATNGTILSGEIDGDNTLAGNSYHVIFNSNNGLTNTSILDGFTVTGGNANGSDEDRRGGGMYNRSSSPRVVNCRFENNAGATGGAMYNEGNSPEIEKCIFQNNNASSQGGAISNKANGNPRIDNCAFLSNTSSNRGGAVDFELSSNLLLTNCQFKDNNSSFLGGAFFTASSSLKFINSSFENNSSSSGGGGYINNSMAEFINCSFQKNTSNAVEVFNLGATSASAQLTNCVLWDNAGANALKTSSNGGPGTPTITVTYSLLDAAISASTYTGGGNNATTASNPFASATSTELPATSPAIDAGSGALYTAASGPANDLAGNPRIANAGLDQGAYEFQGTPVVCVTPTAFTVMGGGAYCAGGAGVVVSLPGTENGNSYQLKRNGSNVGSPVTGTGQSLTFGNQTLAGTYTIVATNPTGGCSNTMTGSVSVSINPLLTVDAGADQSVILGYGGPTSNCTTLTANATGGTGGIGLAWSTGSTSNSIQVCPTTTTTYTVTATDAANCTSAKTITVTVNDVRCGTNNSGVKMCYQGRQVCVAPYLVPTYQRYGGTLGGCNNAPARMGYESEATDLQLTLKAYPNPVQDAVTVEVLSRVAGVATFEVLDVAGRARQSRKQDLVEGLNEVEFRLGTLPTGIYLIKAVDALGQQATVRVSKE